MAPSARPRIEITPTTLDRVLDRLSLAGVLFIVALLASVWDRLPLRVPTHFGLAGRPDAWGSRNTLLLFLVIPAVTHIGLTVLSRFPWVYNYPVQVTQENYRRLYALGRGMMLWLRTEMVWLFVALGWQTIFVALGQASGLGSWLGVGPLAVIPGTVAYFAVRMYRTPGQQR